MSMPFLPGTHIEVVNSDIKRGRIKHALFDFDGTISLIRQGWQGVMIPMMVEILLETPEHESEEEIDALVREFVDQLTGKQTIYQMIRLCEEVQKRGGDPLSAQTYKKMYHERLMKHIKDRRRALESGERSPTELMVPGTRPMLEAMGARDVTCYLASGTDEPYVVEEADLLAITPYFAGIYGALEDYENYSKEMVIERIVDENGLQGSELVSFGDGFVEIEDTEGVGGIAVGVASNEATRRGINEWKRKRLIDAGADVIVPDFREHEHLVTYLFAEE